MSNMAEEVVIRDFVDSDYDQLMALWYKLQLSRPERGDNLEVIHKTLDMGGALLVVPYKDQLIGSAWITNNGRRLYLHHMGVDINFQHQGIGKKLMKSVNAFASQKKMQIKLEVHQQNQYARKLYEKCGFKLLEGYEVLIKREV